MCFQFKNENNLQQRTNEVKVKTKFLEGIRPTIFFAKWKPFSMEQFFFLINEQC